MVFAVLHEQTASRPATGTLWGAWMRRLSNTHSSKNIVAQPRHSVPQEPAEGVRNPPKKIPVEIKAHWQTIQLKEDDARLREERFQIGHMIAIYWTTVSRWMMM